MRLLKLREMRRCRQGRRLFLGLWLGVTTALPCLAQTDAPVELLNRSLRTLDIGFRDGNWATPYGLDPCMHPCSSLSNHDPIHTNPDPAHSYRHDFSFSIKESGPLSFRVTGNRLKMKVEF